MLIADWSLLFHNSLGLFDSKPLAPTDNDSDNESFQSALDVDAAVFGSEAPFGRKKKELSWSDESGQNLVEYMDACTVSFLVVRDLFRSFGWLDTRAQTLHTMSLSFLGNCRLPPAPSAAETTA